MAFVLDRPADAPPEQSWGIGYDGQQAFAIATRPTSAASKLDLPSYRYMRITYPILAHVLAFGRPGWVPWTMVSINWLTATLTAWFLARLLEQRGARSWAALIGVFSFHYLIGIRMDLNEPLAFCLALAGVDRAERGKMSPALLFFALAGLTKEIALAFPLALTMQRVWRREFKPAAAITLGAIAPYLLWGLFLTLWLGESPFSNLLARPVLIPFGGLVRLNGVEAQVMIWMWSVLPTLILSLWILGRSFRALPEHPKTESWLFLANAGVVATLPQASWVDPLAGLRLSIGVIFAALLYFAREEPKGLGLAAGLLTPSLLMVFLIPGFML